jgi:hypothetical protein
MRINLIINSWALSGELDDALLARTYLKEISFFNKKIQFQIGLLVLIKNNLLLENMERSN